MEPSDVNENLDNVVLKKISKKTSKRQPSHSRKFERIRADHFIGAGATENSERIVRRCREFMPCKRTSCDECQERRRHYFTEAATAFAIERGMNLHCTISWPRGEGEDPWHQLVYLSSMLSKCLTGRVGPFIRTLALGRQEDTPHVHYLINADFKDRFYSLAKGNSPEGSKVFIDTELVKNIGNLLDYFFVKNFTPSVNDPRRIKGIRLLSGSRGKFTYSYPKTRHWKQLKNIRGRYES